LTGKMVVPIVRQPDNTFSAEFLGVPHVLKTEEEAQALEKTIGSSGYYPYRTDSAEMGRITKTEIDRLFVELMIKRLRSWIRLIEERLGGCGIQVYVTGGNDDPLEIEEVLNSSSAVTNAQDKICKIDGHHELISSGLSNPTPWKTKREASEEKLAEKIDTMASMIQDMKSAIFNLHAPPKDSQLDSCPLLDDSVHPPKLVIRQGQPIFHGAGSSSVRTSIEKHQPLLGLFGHIHESRGAVKIGRTLCINPGSEYTEGILRGAIITLDKEKVKGHQLTAG